MKRILSILLLVLGALVLSTCGPSQEQLATMTAAAWTSTPPPTPMPTATAVPYGLTLTVADQAGAPIPGARIVFPGSFGVLPVEMDAQGQHAWPDFRPDIELDVSAQGYLSAHQTATLQRGSNDVNITLQRDPYGLLPADACPSGQKILYLEDFQDGQAQNWPYISAGVNRLMPNGWTLVDESGNKILKHAGAVSPSGDELEKATFDNFAWHAKFKTIGADADMFFMWRVSHPDDVSRLRYALVLGAARRPWMVRFIDHDPAPLVMNTGTAISRLKPDEWHDLTITYYSGVHQVWYDGKKQVEYKDTQPFPAGTLGFETHLDSNKTTQFFIDDMVVCELTAAYEPPAQ